MTESRPDTSCSFLTYCSALRKVPASPLATPRSFWVKCEVSTASGNRELPESEHGGIPVARFAVVSFQVCRSDYCACVSGRVSVQRLSFENRNYGRDYAKNRIEIAQQQSKLIWRRLQ